ncbi:MULTISPECIES: DUF4363 family protein [unclassified Clostridioides]|uniref:DUF4363 family protein n=1 Tax=unclassified Clostridioides TaxID=2635829 RepID=UPI001D0CC59A|nr:DUF4363 family protein [Clostridioides sp. ES-S-0001-02]MCC0639835.1 DUF4363 family protein [Clostridioides sp. ES-S-0049-03]MCC0653582.1 DUF4363 family protein [Clostridioides sp. ES-S-0001-03]MCC0655329.1 DUF4363 family protein [Clostridioides sp. ES-S-0123-01]MCC0671304.1 DUF4363 family protein [Clostridioides sp. ES-S-0145-01]MCC0674888.1 DUF4363 family protein [Clostridioides sp. ES-W-0018-02]MCC0679418.1 DUF4363 family protein [Clostridioides sp. ES-S-0005-03]MCC0696501.1 DUF4363 fa
MKSTTFVILWAVLFMLFGFYVNNKLYDFTEDYKNNMSILEKSIENEEWEKAQKEADSISTRWSKERNHWYKVLNHEYFDEIGLKFNILDKAIYTENKLKSLEEVESIKTYLGNIVESVKFDINYIF